jgi:hypothetical protein
MKPNLEPKNPTSIAKALGLLVFGLMSLISPVIFYTNDQLTGVDCLLSLGAPFPLGDLTYFVVLYHDPTAPD